MVVIFFDAAVGQLIGSVLDSQWQGQKGDDDEYIYPAGAYQKAFIIMPVSFACSFTAAILLRPYAARLDSEEALAHAPAVDDDVEKHSTSLLSEAETLAEAQPIVPNRDGLGSLDCNK